MLFEKLDGFINENCKEQFLLKKVAIVDIESICKPSDQSELTEKNNMDWKKAYFSINFIQFAQ